MFNLFWDWYHSDQQQQMKDYYRSDMEEEDRYSFCPWNNKVYNWMSWLDSAKKDDA